MAPPRSVALEYALLPAPRPGTVFARLTALLEKAERHAPDQTRTVALILDPKTRDRTVVTLDRNPSYGANPRIVVIGEFDGEISQRQIAIAVREFERNVARDPHRHDLLASQSERLATDCAMRLRNLAAAATITLASVSVATAVPALTPLAVAGVIGGALATAITGQQFLASLTDPHASELTDRKLNHLKTVHVHPSQDNSSTETEEADAICP